MLLICNLSDNGILVHLPNSCPWNSFVWDRVGLRRQFPISYCGGKLARLTKVHGPKRRSLNSSQSGAWSMSQWTSHCSCREKKITVPSHALPETARSELSAKRFRFFISLWKTNTVGLDLLHWLPEGSGAQVRHVTGVAVAILNTWWRECRNLDRVLTVSGGCRAQIFNDRFLYLKCQ